MAYYTRQDLALETDPGFLVDVILRQNGNLWKVFPGLLWEDALLRAEDAFADGFTVEMEETQWEVVAVEVAG